MAWVWQWREISREQGYWLVFINSHPNPSRGHLWVKNIGFLIQLQWEERRSLGGLLTQKLGFSGVWGPWNNVFKCGGGRDDRRTE